MPILRLAMELCRLALRIEHTEPHQRAEKRQNPVELVSEAKHFGSGGARCVDGLEVTKAMRQQREKGCPQSQAVAVE